MKTKLNPFYVNAKYEMLPYFPEGKTELGLAFQKDAMPFRWSTKRHAKLDFENMAKGRPFEHTVKPYITYS